MSVQVGNTIDGVGTLHVTDCPTCGVVYAIPDGLYRRGQRYKENVAIYCPNGHTWHYLGKTHAEELDELRDQVARQRSLRDQAEASERAQRAAATRARNERDRLKVRAAAGVCPCCNRTFKQLARHMETKHPDYRQEVLA
jgi:hypothetical protein